MLSRKSRRFIREVCAETPILRMTLLFLLLWLLFAAGVYWSERGIADSSITSYGRALYWGVAAFSTAGIADMPLSPLGELLGALWIVIGSIIFFGAIIATITAYFMKQLQRPGQQLLETIEYHLERLDDLSLEELELLKSTIDGLIEHMEVVKERKVRQRGEKQDPASPGGPEAS